MPIASPRPHPGRAYIAVTLALALIAPSRSPAQTPTDRIEGLRDNTPRLHALTGARLVIAPDRIVENGTVVIRDGIIVAAGTGVQVPAGARVWKLNGRTVYPGFIDLASNLGVPASLRPPPPKPMQGDRPRSERSEAPRPPPLGARALASANPRVHPEQDVAQLLEFKPDDVKAARGLGFTSVLATPAAGVFRGQGALVNLADAADAKAQVLAPRAALHLAHEFGDDSSTGYPTSLMGAIALVRQTFYDARWYRGATEFAARGSARDERPEANASLEALAPALAGRQPVVYVADDEQDYQRIAKIRDEFGLRVVLQGNGHEYRRVRDLAIAKLPVIVPLNFPPVPEIESPDNALDTPLEALQHWEQAPSNLALLNRAGIEVAITSAGLKQPAREFWPRLRQSVKRGLPADKALAALTTMPARLIGEGARLGTLDAGRIANIVVAKGDLFADDQAAIELVFVDGRPHATEAYDRFDARGTWAATSGGRSSTWAIAGTADKPVLTLDGTKCPLTQRGRELVVRLPCESEPKAAADAASAAPPASSPPAPATPPRPPVLTIVVEGRDDTLRGSAQSADGTLVPWSATRSAAFTEPPPNKPPEVTPAPPGSAYPAGAFGIDAPARPPLLLVRNATVWTSAAQGRLERADLLVRDGKIAAIGTALPAPSGALVIDASGKHVTPGIVDAHSHTAIIGGVNEATSSVTAEVRIGDVIDATDIGIYRELAGGVTAANVLHGSANTIGGQNQVIKLRWGADGEALKFEGAMPGIKFALGENVKQANWGEMFRSRYPQTRMGVEQILRDAFATARAYTAEREAWQRAPREHAEPRRDLQLDTLAEILAKRRIVHIHSYRQDEILMFARLSQELGFTVGTFQHVLEGYKVADVIAKIGAGGSTFSDWWAYKMEVMDAIPHNGALMQSAGVLTSFNSDSDELARRLNTEAAKAVKYGALDEAEALKFVTINPARQLRIDARSGSLEVGKDADFVIWSGHPLSTLSRAEQTWIDGRRYFDLATDAQLRAANEAERARLIAKALPVRLAAIGGGGGGGDSNKSDDAKPGGKPEAESVSYAELLHRVHNASARRGSYWGREAQHECTEESP
jgi:imidazolonepropionase-like amidohydrolase